MGTLKVIRHFYQLFFGSSGFGALFLVMLGFLLFRRERREESRALAVPAAVILCVILCPLTAWVIIRGIGQDVFWRSFWMLPLTALTAWGLTELAGRARPGIRRAGAVAVILMLLALNGTLVFGDAFFTPRENGYKLPQDVIDVVDVINDHARRFGVRKKSMAAPQEITVYARLYDASLLQKHGRNIAFHPELQTQFYALLNSDAPDLAELTLLSREKKCRYVVLKKAADDRQAMSDGGYVYVSQTAGHVIYFSRRYYRSVERRRLKDLKVHVKKKKLPAGQWTVTQFGFRDINSMFYTIYDPDKGLVVIDGGWREDEDYVRKVIRRMGGHVSAWIITHPHQDHCGAFNAIWADPRDILIDAVYTTPMASPEECLEAAPWDSTDTYEDFLALDIPCLHYLHRGDTLDILGLKIQVLNAFDDQVRALSKDYLNDGSLMFKVTGNERSMLFCGDVGKAMSKLIYSEYKDILQAELVQMAHHGNGGLKENFYRKVAPGIAYFDAPGWLMEDPEGKYDTPAKVRLMSALGCKIKSFAGAPHYAKL